LTVLADVIKVGDATVAAADAVKEKIHDVTAPA